MLERAHELAVLDDCLRQSAAGSGRAVLVDGPPGIGKSRLLAEASAQAKHQGFRVLRGRGSELESAFAFGVVRQLFEPLFVRPVPGRRETTLAGAARLCETLVAGVPEPTDQQDAELSLRRLHGLYWLCANLSAEAPLLLALDDLQWADSSSAQFVAYLAARLDGLPVAIVAATRREARPALLDPLEPLRPHPLTREGIAALARAVLGRTPSAEFVARCHEATGGIPFLALALLRALDDDHRIADVGPEEIARSIAGRLERLPPSATALCRAVAILGGRAELRQAATLTRTDPVAALADLDALCAADILEPTGQFVHPIVQTAIYTHLPNAERDAGHLAAARLLDAEGRSAEEVAAHLMRVQPRGDPWVARTLLEAAQAAGGAAGEVASILTRALREPPPAELRAEAELALGVAEIRLDREAGLQRLADAVDRVTDPRRRAAGVAELVMALTLSGRMAEGLAIVERAIDAVAPDDREAALALESVLGAASKHAEPRPQLASRWKRYGPITGATTGERMLLGEIAWHRAMNGGRAAELGDLAEHAISDGAATMLLGYGAQPQFFQAACLIATCDRYERAETALLDSLAAGRAAGSWALTQVAEHWLAHLALRRGRLREAEAHAAVARDLGSSMGWGASASRAVFAQVLVARGELDEAERALDLTSPAGDLPVGVIWSLALEGRVVLRLAQGRFDEALDDLAAVRRRERGDRADNPAECPWRSQTALALHASGDGREAHRLAAEEVEIARAFGAPRALGVAIRAMGLSAAIRFASRRRLACSAGRAPSSSWPAPWWTSARACAARASAPPLGHL